MVLCVSTAAPVAHLQMIRLIVCRPLDMAETMERHNMFPALLSKQAISARVYNAAPAERAEPGPYLCNGIFQLKSYCGGDALLDTLS